MYLLLKHLLAITTNFFKHVSLLIFHDYLYLFCLLFIVIGTNSQIPVNTPDQFLIGDFLFNKNTAKTGCKGPIDVQIQTTESVPAALPLRLTTATQMNLSRLSLRVTVALQSHKN